MLDIKEYILDLIEHPKKIVPVSSEGTRIKLLEYSLNYDSGSVKITCRKGSGTQGRFVAGCLDTSLESCSCRRNTIITKTFHWDF